MTPTNWLGDWCNFRRMIWYVSRLTTIHLILVSVISEERADINQLFLDTANASLHIDIRLPLCQYCPTLTFVQHFHGQEQHVEQQNWRKKTFIMPRFQTITLRSPKIKLRFCRLVFVFAFMLVSVDTEIWSRKFHKSKLLTGTRNIPKLLEVQKKTFDK